MFIECAFDLFCSEFSKPFFTVIIHFARSNKKFNKNTKKEFVNTLL